MIWCFCTGSHVGGRTLMLTLSLGRSLAEDAVWKELLQGKLLAGANCPFL